MRPLVLVSALFLVASASTGCAVLAAKAPDPDRPRDEPPMCNDGNGGVVVDGLMATTLGIVTLALASNDGGGAAVVTGLGALAYGGSAAAGSSSAKKCREAMDEYVAMREREKSEANFARNAGASGGSLGGMAIAPEDEDEPVATAPPPRPQVQPQPQPPASKPQPQPPPPVTRPAPREPASHTSDDGDWSEFWKEVP